MPRRSQTRSAPFPRRPRGRADYSPSRNATDQVLLYGLHAVEAALANPRREIRRVLATPNAARRLEPALAQRGVRAEETSPKLLDRMLGADLVHQGVLLETEPLPLLPLDALELKGMLVVLDQVTDPHNVGAVLRSAAAFGASALVLHDRHSPPLAGALAKAASGALDLVPVVLAPNLARALGELGERGVFRVGLAEQGAEPLERTRLADPLALVLGAEGKGLRQLTREHCDRLCRISTQNAFASLNVSNAAAIALHWASTMLAERKP